MTTVVCSGVWLPPEIWRICLRWATLPPTGRSPWDDPRTHLDPWYRRSITQRVASDRTALCDTLEQLSVYPSKRAVVLVCKAWNQIATEYLYEHIVCGVPDLIGCSALITILQRGAKGEQLARLVIRVDIYSTGESHQLQSTFLRICPNLQSIYLNAFPFFDPAPYSSEQRNLPILSIRSDLLQTPEYEPFWSAADHWRSLTIRFEIHEPNGNPLAPITEGNILPPPPHSDGKEFLNLRHILFSGSRYSIRNLSHWPLPSLTHLTIKSYFLVERIYDDILDALQSSQLGPRLKYFALLVHHRTPSYNTTISGSLALLKAMPNLEEVALPFFWVSAPPPIMEVTLSRIHTVGMETDRLDYTAVATPEIAFATYVEICCRLFPNMRKIRTTATTSLHTVSYFLTMKVGPMVHLKTAAAVLKERGIKFEDCAGWDITQLWS